MRVVSLNAWGGALWDELAAWLPTMNADVLCLQEVTRTSGLSGWTAFSDGEHTLPQRADLFDDVRGVLPRHYAQFAASDAGPVRDGAGRPWRQEFGLGTWTSPELTLLSSATRFVHGSFAEHEEWPTGGRPRIAQAVRVGGDGRTVTVVQLHGLRDPAGKADTPERTQQAKRLAAFVDDVRVAGDLVVVCGDLNLLPGSETFAVLRTIGLTDLVGTEDTRTEHYAKPVRHASYLLVSDPGAVRELRIVGRPAVSDHCALVLDV
ncbi:endonuclease/exonuclease/phosphatase family metal-dependent hydrolase [Motilibacter peucedani]|uniref:Endonuclease/exonuclease/phosphatase family metal-dependent hydrolase n=1 Tax=Motilibacter peucedani TaxID=598650 RepID=A0A420XQS6_9ACTN|nr:endonuclease/exonuclease/phosphatase family protein [Motilibacter peucedani]RKS75597.1 endonuclease/exonuclease/phosphatase family metal-dependent hydrolase [Motilibacter peucedani]